MPRFIVAIGLLAVACLDDFTIADPPTCGPVALEDCSAFKVRGYDTPYYGEGCEARIVPVDRDVPPGWIVCEIDEDEKVLEAWEAGIMWTGEPVFALDGEACVEAEWEYFQSHPSYGTPVDSCDL